jgi:flagellar hook-length control protein FliK
VAVAENPQVAVAARGAVGMLERGGDSGLPGTTTVESRLMPPDMRGRTEEGALGPSSPDGASPRESAVGDAAAGGVSDARGSPAGEAAGHSVTAHTPTEGPKSRQVRPLSQETTGGGPVERGQPGERPANVQAGRRERTDRKAREADEQDWKALPKSAERADAPRAGTTGRGAPDGIVRPQCDAVRGEVAASVGRTVRVGGAAPESGGVRGDAAEAAGGGTSQDARAIGKQIVEQARVIRLPQKTEVEIKLKPASLGRVFLRVSLEAGRLSARFTVSRSDLKEAIESRMAELKEDLAADGLHLEDVSVTVGGGHTSAPGHWRGDWQGRWHAPEPRGDAYGTHRGAEIESERHAGAIRRVPWESRALDLIA